MAWTCARSTAIASWSAARMNEPSRAMHAWRCHAFALPLPAADAFPLFTPAGERAWAEGWDPEFLHPADGSTREGMVFRTRAGDEETLWVLTRHEPGNGVVEYARVTPGSRAGRVLVRCDATSAATSRVTVEYDLTGLSDAGNGEVTALAARYASFIEGWRAAIEAFLARRGSPARPATP
jgi:hypothetical protein